MWYLSWNLNASMPLCVKFKVQNYVLRKHFSLYDDIIFKELNYENMIFFPVVIWSKWSKQFMNAIFISSCFEYLWSKILKLEHVLHWKNVFLIHWFHSKLTLTRNLYYHYTKKSCIAFYLFFLSKCWYWWKKDIGLKILWHGNKIENAD